jgi:PAS domain S-box-containing protein
VRARQIAPLALVLGLTVAGFLIAHLVGERDARRDSEHRAEVAAAQIRDRVVQGASLTESLRRFMLDRSGIGVTSDQFARNALRWLTPAGFPAAAWVERVRQPRRSAYERRLGHAIVTPDQRHGVARGGSRASYLPATLVSGFDPLAVPGTDLGGEPGMASALTRATRLDRVAATAVASRRGATSGLFLVAPAPNLIDDALRPGYVAVFVSDRALRAAATDAPTLEVTGRGAPAAALDGVETVRGSFVAAGQRFDVVVPQRSVEGAAAALPWIILAAGLVLAGLAAALGVNAARRARAQQDFDRIFNLSPDLVAVANFDGHFTRVNPAAEEILGYTEAELLTRPYLDLVHPDDRERTAAEAAAIGEGKRTLSFENRLARKDGSYRVLDWTSTPVVEERAMYAVARDVTERREAESELERLAGEQAALRRVATLVAQGGSAAEVFDSVAREMERALGADGVTLGRYEPAWEVTVVAHSGPNASKVPVGTRVNHEGENVTSLVRRTERPARLEHYDETQDEIAELVKELGVRASVAAPIVVEGRLWGVTIANWRGDVSPPPETEERMSRFAELLDTAIANADSRDQLTASRARLVTAGDEARRHVVRDLHDGAQQHLVHTIVTLKLAQQALKQEDGKAESLVGEALEEAEHGNAELRELAHGLLPAVLTRGGLGAAISTLVTRLDLPVQADVPTERLPAEIEASAYFIVAEALTNVVKHSHASEAEVRASLKDEVLHVEVRDDGIGGADPDGHGLVGLSDRATALGGRFRVESPVGGGTLVAATLPL